jgi:hypothetical protein
MLLGFVLWSGWLTVDYVHFARFYFYVETVSAFTRQLLLLIIYRPSQRTKFLLMISFEKFQIGIVIYSSGSKIQ